MTSNTRTHLLSSWLTILDMRLRRWGAEQRLGDFRGELKHPDSRVQACAGKRLPHHPRSTLSNSAAMKTKMSLILNT